MFCPFCMKHHPLSTRICPEKLITIPPMYRDEIQRGVPVVMMLTIGYSGHGKTCFLSSFFRSLFRKDIAKIWHEFAFVGMTMETLNTIHCEYVGVLNMNRVPPKTSLMFPTPLIIKFQQIPLTRKHARHAPREAKDLIGIFYDIGGGTFDMEERIRERVPLVQDLSTWVVLLSLPTLLWQAYQVCHMHHHPPTKRTIYHLVDNTLTSLLTTLIHAGGGESLHKKHHKKNMLVCFTMQDRMRGNKKLYGKLAHTGLEHQRLIPDNTPEGFESYFGMLEEDSHVIGTEIEEKYGNFFTMLRQYFHGYFTSISALGSQPSDGIVPHVQPVNIFTPFLWLLKLEQYV